MADFKSLKLFVVLAIVFVGLIWLGNSGFNVTGKYAANFAGQGTVKIYAVNVIKNPMADEMITVPVYKFTAKIYLIKDAYSDKQQAIFVKKVKATTDNVVLQLDEGIYVVKIIPYSTTYDWVVRRFWDMNGATFISEGEELTITVPKKVLKTFSVIVQDASTLKPIKAKVTVFRSTSLGSFSADEESFAKLKLLLEKVATGYTQISAGGQVPFKLNKEVSHYVIVEKSGYYPKTEYISLSSDNAELVKLTKKK